MSYLNKKRSRDIKIQNKPQQFKYFSTDDIKVYLENPVGIGEHPQHLDELDKQFGKIAEAEDKLKALEDFQLDRKEM